MAAIDQPAEGSALVQYRIALPKQQYLSLNPDTITFVEAIVNDNVRGGSDSMHILRCNDPAFVSTLKNAMASADPHILFRMGFGTPSSMYWLPWQDHLIVDYSPKFEGIGSAAGHLIVLNTHNELTRMRRSNRVAARKGTISDIVSAIAADNGLKSVVEPTAGKFVFIQNFIDDTQFIAERLLCRAINQQGKAGYFFFLRDGALHFHTPDYQSSVKNVDYYGTPSSSLETLDQSQNPDLWDEGVAGVSVILHDPYTGQFSEVTSVPAKALKLADSIYQYASVKNGSWNILYHLGSNPVIEASALAQSRYQQARMQAFRVILTLQKIISIRHGDLIQLSLAQQNSQNSTYAGYYYVSATSVTIKKGQATAVYTLERGETQPQRGLLTTQDSGGQLVSESSAPGISPNIIEVQNSELTKGVGNRSSTTSFSSVLNPQTGLP